VTEDNRRYVLIGTAGHVDHGKTALVKMLTGCETDTLKEEKERGLTIDLGYAPCELRGDLLACMVDVPGHEKFIRNMVAGASGIDAVLLVVAADDSVMPQTIEHLRIVELLGIKRGMVAVTKIDMVDEELRELVVEEVKEFLEGTFLEDAPICPVSSITGEGFEDLWLALTKVVDSCLDRPVEGIFRMPVERVFSPAGFGTVITGMPFSGRVKVGDRLEMLPQGEKGRLRGLQVYGKSSDSGWAGQCLATNVTDVNHREVMRGNVLATPGYLTPTKMVECRFDLLPGADRPLKHQAPVRFHTGTSEIMGRVFYLDRERLNPGEGALMQFRADEELIVAPGDRFVVRQYSPVVTIGGGRVLRPSKRKVKRFKDGIIRDLTALEEVLDDPTRLVEYHLDRAAVPIRADALTRQSYLPAARAEEIIEELALAGRVVRLSGGLLASARTLAGVEARVTEALAAFHRAQPLRRGLEPNEVKKTLADDSALVDAAVEALTSRNEVVRSEGLLALASHEVTMSPAEEAMAGKVTDALREAGVAPPDVARLAKDFTAAEADIRIILDALVDRGEVVRLSDSYYAHATGEQAARDLLVNWLKEKGQIGVVDYRDLLEASRKYVYAWLDHFDRLGVTYRAENLRHLKSGGDS
jgi:selenocysteine-specific elongation factor